MKREATDQEPKQDVKYREHIDKEAADWRNQRDFARRRKSPRKYPKGPSQPPKSKMRIE
jgi:hypothetical protein